VVGDGAPGQLQDVGRVVAHQVARVSQFLALVADPWVVGHAGDAGLVDLGV
jgi:hypothetical protein